MNSLPDSKTTRFDHLPPGLGAGLMPEGNRLLGCVDRRANVFAAPLGAEPPDLVQHFDCTTGVDFAHEMQSSSRERHTTRWDQMTQGCAQPPDRHAASHLSRSLACQGGRIILVHVPAPEERDLCLDLVQIGELVPRPKAAYPEAVKAFDLVVALGLVIGREEWFDATEQTQSYDLPKHMR